MMLKICYQHQRQQHWHWHWQHQRTANIKINIINNSSSSHGISGSTICYLLYVVCCVCISNRMLITLSISSIDNMCVRSIALIWLTENSRPTDLSKTCVFVCVCFFLYFQRRTKWFLPIFAIFIRLILENVDKLISCIVYKLLKSKYGYILFNTWMLFMSTYICDDTFRSWFSFSLNVSCFLFSPSLSFSTRYGNTILWTHIWHHSISLFSYICVFFSFYISYKHK